MGTRPYPSYYTSVEGEAISYVIGFIARTTKTIDCMVYSITHPDIVAELIAAHRRGVRVRIITDDLQASGRYSLDEELMAAGIEVRVDNSSGAMHHKDAICDLNVTGLYALLSGSFNWTKSAATKNAETAVILRTKKECLKAQAEFDRLWEKHAPSD